MSDFCICPWNHAYPSLVCHLFLRGGCLDMVPQLARIKRRSYVTGQDASVVWSTASRSVQQSRSLSKHMQAISFICAPSLPSVWKWTTTTSITCLFLTSCYRIGISGVHLLSATTGWFLTSAEWKWELKCFQARLKHAIYIINTWSTHVWSSTARFIAWPHLFAIFTYTLHELRGRHRFSICKYYLHVKNVSRFIYTSDLYLAFPEEAVGVVHFVKGGMTILELANGFYHIRVLRKELIPDPV